MNDELCKGFIDKEISDALFQIGPLKASGPGGFPTCFFQRNWGMLKEDVVRTVKGFFDLGHMPVGVNNTTIALIPKKEEPEFLKDFRLSPLCNVIYKVVSKCLVNKLMPLLQDLVEPMQRAFVPGRLITDNALIAFECLHAINREMAGVKSLGP
jgi:hypothetical protein